MDVNVDDNLKCVSGGSECNGVLLLLSFPPFRFMYDCNPGWKIIEKETSMGFGFTQCSLTYLFPFFFNFPSVERSRRETLSKLEGHVSVNTYNLSVLLLFQFQTQLFARSNHFLLNSLLENLFPKFCFSFVVK